MIICQSCTQNVQTKSIKSTDLKQQRREIIRLFLWLLQMLTLGVGVGVLLTSLLLTYIISSKADMLFSSGREPTNATYWSTRRRRRPTTTTTAITTTTTTSIPTRHGRARFSLKHNTSRYTDRLDTAAAEGFLFYTTTPCLWTHSGETWHEDWTGLDWPGWIWTHQGQKTLVRHQQALPVEKMFIFVLF